MFDHRLLAVHLSVKHSFDSLNEVIVEHFAVVINKDLVLENHLIELN